MTPPLFAAIALIGLCMLLGYLALGRIDKASQALGRRARSSSSKHGASLATDPLTGDRLAVVALQEPQWTALDDRQFARFVRDSTH